MLNSIIYGNCLDEVKKIADNSIHAIISDIPQGIGYDDWDILHSNTNSALGGQSKAQNEAGASP